MASKRVANDTARVHWFMGQGLLPAHFEAQESGLEEQLRLRFSLLPTAAWGVGSLTWDNKQLIDGVVSIAEMSLILPSGTLIDIPGNADPISEKFKDAGSRVSLYVHLLKERKIVSVPPGANKEDQIALRMLKIRLSTDIHCAEGEESGFHLADLQNVPGVGWELSPSYIPPLLQILSSAQPTEGIPFFRATLDRIKRMKDNLKQAMQDEVHANFLSENHNVSGRLVLRGIFALQALIVDAEHGVSVHPYEMFKALRSLYIDFCVHQDTVPSAIEVPFDHAKMAGCFDLLLGKFEEAERTAKKQVVPYVRFERQNGRLVATLPAEMRRARDAFLLAQKPQLGARIDLTRIKLASPERLQETYDRALTGIPIQHIRNPPFQHGLASSVEFYALASGVEWDYAIKEGMVAFLDEESLKKTEFYLYWRPD